MSDYISRDTALDELEIVYIGVDKMRYDGAVKIFKSIPAADVRENIYGEWIPYPGGYVCSNCRKKDRKTATIYMKAYQYCSDCGCKMRVRKENNGRTES